MTFYNTGVSAMVVTCAFAMFAIAAIPTHAKAATTDYYNGSFVSPCAYTYCGATNYSSNPNGNVYFYGGNTVQPVVTTYTYPVYSTSYPVYFQRPRRTRATVDPFFRDWVQAGQEWDAQMRYYNTWPL